MGSFIEGKIEERDLRRPSCIAWGERTMKRTKNLSRAKLFIRDLERPAPAIKGKATTLAIGEEALWKGDSVTTLALNEEA